MKALFLLLSLILAPYGRAGLSLNGEWSAIVEQGEYHILVGDKDLKIVL